MLVGISGTTSEPTPGEPPAAAVKRPERLEYIDVARALAVLGVIVGHAWFGSLTERVLLSVDLPLFFFLSGFVYSEKYNQRPDLLAWRRLQTLYFPFIRWGLFWLALHNVLFYAGIYSAQAGYLGQTSELYSAADFVRAAWRILTFRGTEPMAGALWFLRSLFFTNIVFGLLSFGLWKLFQRPNEPVRAACVLVLAALGYISNPVLNNRVHVGTSLVALLVFYGGLLFRRHERVLPLKWYIALLAATLVSFNHQIIFFGSNEYANPLLLFTIVPAGIYAALFLSKLLERNRLLQYVGTNTIFIIATHFLAFKLVSLLQIRIFGYPDYFLAKFPVISGQNGWWIAYALCGLFLPVAAKLAIDYSLRRVKTWRLSLEPGQGRSTGPTRSA